MSSCTLLKMYYDICYDSLLVVEQLTPAGSRQPARRKHENSEQHSASHHNDHRPTCVDAVVSSFPKNSLETMLLLSRVGMNYLDKSQTCASQVGGVAAVGRPHVRDDQNSNRC